jgi:hypothetical protein
MVSLKIGLSPEIASKVRQAGLIKYGNLRSTSKLVEEFIKAGLDALDKPPETCSILGHRSEHSFKAEAYFKKNVEEITAQLSKIRVFYDVQGARYSLTGADMYFALKEACELRINEEADAINRCWSCVGLNGPLSKYPDAGRNFEIFATMYNDVR